MDKLLSVTPKIFIINDVQAASRIIRDKSLDKLEIRAKLKSPLPSLSKTINNSIRFTII